MRAVVLVGLSLLACDQSVPNELGVNEPIRVHNGQFIPGPLPGLDGGTGPTITNITVTNNTVQPGQASKSINGRAQAAASGVALRFPDLGTGYWVVPIGNPDGQFPGELTWQATTDFSLEAAANAPGHHTLQFVAIDVNGNPGTPAGYDVCLEPIIPDNGATCDFTKKTPAAVITLTWDADSDVDLTVVGPDGRVTDPKHPATIAPDAGTVDPTAGVIDRDSLAGCIPDGKRQEDLIWQQLPPNNATYALYANLFDGCGQPGVSYTMTVYEFVGGVPVVMASTSQTPHCPPLTTCTASGVFTSYDANGGAALGTHLFSFTF